VKCTVSLDVATHTKLAAAAAMKGCDRSTIAAGFIKAGLRGLVVIDKRNHASSVEADDRQGPGFGISLAGEESAA
jgi:hypothetical protein